MPAHHHTPLVMVLHCACNKNWQATAPASIPTLLRARMRTTHTTAYARPMSHMRILTQTLPCRIHSGRHTSKCATFSQAPVGIPMDSRESRCLLIFVHCHAAITTCGSCTCFHTSSERVHNAENGHVGAWGGMNDEPQAKNAQCKQA